MVDETFRLDDVLADLDRTGPVPLYHQVAAAIEAAILSGKIPAGVRFENEVAIAERVGMSRPTIRRAMQELVDQGYLIRRRGVGTQVVHGQFTRRVDLTSLYDDLRESKHNPETRVLTHEVRTADVEVAAALGIATGTEVLYLRRLRRADGSPLAILTNYLPVEYADLTIDQLESRGLYQLLRTRGVTIRVANQKIGARRAEPDEAELLDVEAGSPLLTMERAAFDNAGRAVELGFHCYRPDVHSFETKLIAK